MKTIRLMIILLVLSVLLTLLLLVQKGIIRFPWQPERITHVYTELIESSESSLLQTAEFRFKLIFPYDFVDEGDEVNWQFLQRQFENLPEEFPMRASEEFYFDREIPFMWKYAELYALCRECGIDPAGRGEDFIVVSTRTRAGFNFNEESIFLDTELPDGKVVLTLPGPEITAIIIEDRIAEDGGYPELEMSPSQWSRFITALTPEIAKLAVDEGILDLAEETARFLLSDLFGGAGLKLQRIDFNYETAE
ncbi:MULTISPECIES: DUF4230 domain-containing protein [unclassified Oceanispirochaeta]|uniref:DUF4230 domain-containing protein n=1 Tax=unclassified Oceanispirochaeta TaxID=2635722 RepID=UPI000E0911E2|nr:MULTISPECIES: DUF4230 domain-containing protein [unclassified Oceanispirochaeta]MBF9015494.1 DUF4230 domain-containing protein [Oceanispirochaeta sp. M2]NPD71953.1 DUF4230 domain-containing protein [Oceanispirochaeta sp. M1]RDG32760.1 DUF4230 domain-containing protein [Oceanispirochaeta sp. M1]